MARTQTNDGGEEEEMDETRDLIKTAVEEIQRLLSTDRVVGEPITVGDNTIIPLVYVGFGFGAGGGTGKGGTAEKEMGEGTGGGAGGGGGVRPVAVIVVNEEGVRVEPMKGTISSLVESVSGVVARVIEKREAGKEEKGDNEDK